MALAMKNLADGQLPAVTGDLYTSTGVQTLIKTIKLVNTDSAARTVNIYLLPNGGTARRIIPKDCSMGIGYMIEEECNLTLDAGDKIQGDASAATAVDFIIQGAQD